MKRWWRKHIEIAGLIYEDELDALGNLITIVDTKEVEKRMCDDRELTLYQITILSRDLNKLKEIMRDKGCKYNIRKR